MLHFHTSSFTIVQRHLLIYYIYSSPIDTKLVENASLPLIPSQSSSPDLSICPFLYIRLSAQPPPLHAYFFLVRVFSSRGKSSITEINSSLAVLIVDALHQTTMRDAFPESIYTHTHTRTSVHRHANVRSIFIYNRSSFILFFLLFFSFFFSPPFLLAFVPQTILLSSPGIWNQTGVTHVAYAQSPLDRSHRNYECV